MRGLVKRVLTIALAALMLFSALAGCSGTPGEDGQTPASTDTGAASPSPAADEWADWAPVEGKKYTISWTCYQMSPTPANAKMVKYWEEKFNVDFDVWNIEHQQYEELLNIHLASGEIPDLVHITPPSNLTKYRQQDILADIPVPILEKYLPYSLQGLNEQAPGYIDYGKIDGRQYGIPSVSVTNLLRLPIAYRQDWLDKLGKKIPATIDEFEEVIYAFANEDPDGNRVKDTYGLSQDGLLLLYGMYGAVPEQQYFQEKDGRLVFGMIEPEMKEALAYANKWHRDGVIDPEFITGENTGGYWALSHSFINGKIGMTVRGNYYHWVSEGDYLELDQDGNEVPTPSSQNTKETLLKFPDAKIGFGQPLINKDGGQGGVKGWNLLSKFYAVGADASNDKEPGKMAKILQILDFMGGNPNVDEHSTARYGIQGEDWEWMEKDRNTVRQAQRFLDQPGLRFEEGSVFWWTTPLPGKQYRSRQEEWAYKIGFDKGGLYSAIQVSTPAMSKYDAELQAMREQAYIQIITGDKPLDYFDTFVNEYLASGGQEILDEVNEWYKGTQK